MSNVSGNSTDKKRLAYAKLRAESSDKLLSCFVAGDLDSRPRGNARKIIMDTEHRGHWIIGANRSSKTSTGAREVAWWFLGTHPFKKRLPEWADQPLLIIVAGRTGQLITEELWANKLKPLLPPGSFRNPQKEGAFIKSVEHVSNGNRLLFLSHHDAKNAREKVQGFTAHVVWLDEMPDDESFLAELLLRVSATSTKKIEPGMTLSGYFYGTFTPLVENPAIQQLVDECQFPFKKWILRLEDNPIYEGWTVEQLDDLIRSKCGDEVEFQARRHGAWYFSSERVFRGYDPYKNRAPLPFTYAPSLQHAVVVDPAASGKVGVTLWCKSPTHPAWWCVKALTMDGSAASLLVREIETSHLSGIRLPKGSRICDSSPSGFYKEAQVQGIDYSPITDKMAKKLESIENVNVAWHNGLLMMAEGKATETLHTEMLQAKWKPTEKEIVNSHKYHCADTVRYLWMKKPKDEEMPRIYESVYHEMKQSQLAEERKASIKIAEAMKRKSKIWGRKYSGRRAF